MQKGQQPFEAFDSSCVVGESLGQGTLSRPEASAWAELSSGGQEEQEGIVDLLESGQWALVDLTSQAQPQALTGRLERQIIMKQREGDLLSGATLKRASTVVQ